MLNFIISLLLGILPDILYYYIYIKSIKKINTKNILFFILLCINYILCIILIQHQFYLYIIQDIIIYFIIKKLYSSQINDVFLVIFLETYMLVLALISFNLIENYIVSFVVYRIFLFLPLIFKNRIINFYENYTKLWNRHNIPHKIKSITLRNISLVVLNIMIILMYIILLHISIIK
jgi:hypothetical protein